MLYHSLIEKHLSDERVVLSDGKIGLTFQQLHGRTARYCAVFRRRKLKKGDRVLAMTNNLLETVVIMLACMAEGLIFVPVNQKLDEESKAYIIRDCRPALIMDTEVLQTFGDEDDMTDYLADRERCGEDTLAYIIYTSGTEGMPKGVTASQKQIFFCCEAINKRLGYMEKDNVLCCLPLSFDYGLYQIFLAFFSGAVLFLYEGEVIQRIPYLLRHWDITVFPAFPSLANILVKTGMLRGEDYPHLRCITFTGEVLQTSLIRELETLCPGVRVIPMYGLTECKRVSIMPKGREDKVREGSCGIPLDGVKVYLKRTELDDETGELVVEGNNVMEGYWGISDEYTDVFATNKDSGKRVVYTGDLFRIDEEGFLYFCGRKNSILKIWGHRISCVWIEEKIKEIQGVREAAVTGIADEEAGERAVLFLYVSSEVTKEHIKSQMREFPGYMQRYDLYMEKKPLPKNQNGKIDMHKLQKIAKERNERFCGDEILRE